jgi:predicted MPP superfamily phosphohydrolase
MRSATMCCVRDVTIGLTALAMVSALAGAAVVLVASRWQRVTVPWVLLSLVTSGALTFAGAVVAVVVKLELFGLAHLLYLSAVLTVPLIGSGVLLTRVWSRPSGAALALGALMVLPAPVGWYATHVAPFRLRVDEVQVPVDQRRAGDQTVRIGVLSDLQTTGLGDHERAAVAAVMEAEPDVILLPGDLFQGDHEQLQEEASGLRDLLATLDAPGGVYFVRGDVDRDARVEALLEGTGVVILDDRVQQVRVRDRILMIGGTRKEHSSEAADRVRSELRSAAGGEEITILVSHRPDTVLGLPPSAGIDLTVAGHTHGGQISIPGFGPLATLSEVPRHVGAGGLHEVRGNRIYVSSGVGMERGQAPQVRFFVPPSVGMLELTG